MDYPPARRLEQVDVLHGVPVADPYRWLEDPAAPDTVAWGAAQDTLARAWLDALPGRARLRARLLELNAAGLVGVPVARGGRLFYERREGTQEHPVLLVREPDGTERALVDPSALAQDATVTLDGWVPSLEGTLLACWLSQGGDEETELRVLDVDSGELLDGPIDRTRYCPLAWLPGGTAFYYGRRLAPDQVPAGQAAFHRRVWLHRLGADPADDRLVFGEGRDKTEYHDLHLSWDGRWLAVAAAAGTAPRNDLFLADLHGDGRLRPVVEGLDALTWGGVDHRDGLLWLRTNLDAPRFRLVVADPASPQPDRWRELIGESDAVLEQAALTDDAVVAVSTRHAVGRVALHDRTSGAVRQQLPLPGLGSVLGVSTRAEGGHDAWFGYTDFTTPPRVYRCDAAGGAVELWQAAPGEVDGKAVAARQLTYRSGDDTPVRMFLLQRDDPAVPPGPRPTVLYGYGGFGISLTPAYNPSILAWVEQGGVYAIANLRGGGEEGEGWHRAGMREHKQRVFDDFAAAAEHLIAEGITSPERLGVAGGSNGGLLVGAALTRRPELFAAVVCSAPLLDMLRYERFGLGETWNDEYGRADDPVEFGWLLGYSPYHHVVKGTRYPAVLFTLFDSDTRVDPMHGRKMCAALQWATVSERPVLLRRERNVGHGARSLGRTVELQVDTTAFLAAALGLEVDGPGAAEELGRTAPA